MQSSGFYKFFVAAIVILSIGLMIWLGMDKARTMPLDIAPETASTTARLPQLSEVLAPKGTISVLILSTPEARERGLSGVRSLPKDSGMLFVFPTAGPYGFWMKGMSFAIDIVWIDADKRVSGVVSGIPPESYPEIFYPPSDAMYVLELNTGGAKDYGIATGTKLVF